WARCRSAGRFSPGISESGVESELAASPSPTLAGPLTWGPGEADRMRKRKNESRTTRDPRRAEAGLLGASRQGAVMGPLSAGAGSGVPPPRFPLTRPPRAPRATSFYPPPGAGDRTGTPVLPPRAPLTGSLYRLFAANQSGKRGKTERRQPPLRILLPSGQE